MNWDVERRLDAIDWCLYRNGEIRREHLMSIFGMSKPQASTDFAKYERLYPGAMVYNKSRKCYEAEGHNPRRNITIDSEGRLIFVVSL